MAELGIVEDQIFKKRQQTEEMFRARDKAKRKRMKMAKTNNPTRILGGQFTPTVNLFIIFNFYCRLERRLSLFFGYTVNSQ